MTRLLLVLLIFFYSLPIFSQSSTSGKFGLGLSLFYPTGITGKYFLSDKTAIEGNLGLFSKRTYLHAVFLYNFYKVPSSSANTNLYIGGGLVFHERKKKRNRSGLKSLNRFFNNNDEYESSMGIRVPIGISAIVLENKLELFGELPLHIYLQDDDQIDIGFSLGARYYF
ncbi:MAG: hypothetical protein AAF518_24280 [Spirochaetota bacterium]